jgi:ribonuclease BN (tRNA processing enzyme)
MGCPIGRPTGSVTVEAIRNEHPPLIDSFALRLTGDGKSVTLSGDTAPIDAMIDFAKDTEQPHLTGPSL